MFVPLSLAGAVVVFRGAASGTEAPSRVLQGPKTQIIRPDAVDIDLTHDELFVDSGEESVLVFKRDATGDAAPIRVIEGPKTRLQALYGMAVDPVRDLLFVTSRSAELGRDPTDEILVFKRTDNGDVAPQGSIKGPRTGIYRVRQLVVDAQRGHIFAAVSNNTRVYNPQDPVPTQWDPVNTGFVGVWSVTDRGDVPPRAIVKGPVAGTIWPVGVTINPTAGEVYYVDMVRNGLFTFALPELFRQTIASSMP
jgi:hypothetical protein